MRAPQEREERPSLYYVPKTYGVFHVGDIVFHSLAEAEHHAHMRCVRHREPQWILFLPRNAKPKSKR
jgi:hypothetical protein